ncbi:hypothetical protein UPYG_G00346580 [Umbra pygmaea]|uniref:USP domain-containing protein n=1 Tax=Umbra pygmaea TaxID=75934 RepID=A0ABD0W253_UMBPY
MLPCLANSRFVHCNCFVSHHTRLLSSMNSWFEFRLQLFKQYSSIRLYVTARMAGSSFSRFNRSASLPYGTQDVSRDDTDSSVSEQDKPSAMRGLMNYRLSCCVNALLQSFSATQELVDLLNTWNPDHKDKESVPLELRETLLTMQSDQSHSVPPHQDFLHCLNRNAIRFYVQQDADEVFLSILNFIQQQMSNNTVAQKIQCLYKVNVETYLQCIECKHTNTGTSFVLSLPLNIKESNNTLEDCLRFFFRLQELKDMDKCFCQRCGEKRPSKQGFKLISLPPVLCFHLKRFRNYHGYTRKLNCKVTFPETLNISDILTAEALSQSYAHDNDSQYSLYAVIVHIGEALFGHYTAYIRHHNDKSWYYADDSYVKQVTWEEVQTTYGGQRGGTAYMLLYRRTAKESYSG